MKKSRLSFMALALLSMSISGCGEEAEPKKEDEQEQKPAEKHTCVADVTSGYQTSDTEHWYKCTDATCTKKVNKEEHVFDDGVYTTEPTETTDGSMTTKCFTCGKEITETVPAYTSNYKTVTYKDADGTTLKTRKYAVNTSFREPTRPTAPAGKKFVGWKNAANGGQMWNFTDATLSLLLDDLTLQAVYVDSSMEAQYLEAEFVPAITDGSGMDGATYSGGANGQQFIRADDKYEYGSTCEVESVSYYEDPNSLKYASCETGSKMWACDTCGKTVSSETKPTTCENASDGQHSGYDFDSLKVETITPIKNKCGYFVHFNYKKGNTFTFNVVSDKAVSDATIFASFSAEYGLINEQTNDRYCSFSQTSFPISVNGTDLAYGTITMHNIPAIGDFLYFQDYFLAENVSLNAGNNVITMKVNNEDTLNGTIASTSPCIDNLKIYTSAKLTWTNAKYTNIIGR